MTEPRPEYTTRREETTIAADVLALYLRRRRDLLIAELREIDRLLGRPQTVPERVR